jgi:diketogulonate reductase-like aldo/keto reductase
VAKGRIKNDQTLAQIGQPHGKSAAQVCLRWLVQQNVPAIPRTSRIERLSENIDVFDFALSDDEMDQISQMGSPKGRLTDFGFAPNWD